MDLDALGKSPIGRLAPIDAPPARLGAETRKYWAFVPDPLPEAPQLGVAALDVSTRAAMAVARLDQAMSQLPNPALLLRPIIRREAVSTSALEGTYAAFDEVLESDYLESAQMSPAQSEVHNFVEAAEAAVQMLTTRPISRRVLCRLQKIIVRETPADNSEAGNLRTRQVYIGTRGRDISLARFVPPPAGEELETCFSDWEKWINMSTVPIVIRMALGHYQFETMHPFYDGNGRLGRLVAVLQLLEDGVLASPALNLSPWLESNREAYIDGLLEVSKTGKFDSWVELFSTAVLEQADQGTQAIRDLLAFKESSIARLREAHIRGSAVEIVEQLIGYPLIDVATASRLIGKSFQTANTALKHLVEHGILQALGRGRTKRLFACAEVMDIINRPVQ